MSSGVVNVAGSSAGTRSTVTVGVVRMPIRLPSRKERTMITTRMRKFRSALSTSPGVKRGRDCVGMSDTASRKTWSASSEVRCGYASPAAASSSPVGKVVVGCIACLSCVCMGGSPRHRKAAWLPLSLRLLLGGDELLTDIYKHKDVIADVDIQVGFAIPVSVLKREGDGG